MRGGASMGSRPAAKQPNGAPTTTSGRLALTHFPPYRLMQDAVRAVPAVRYALGVTGIIAVIALVSAFRISHRVAFFGAILTFALMVVLVVFAKLTTTAPRYFVVPVLVLLWTFLTLTMLTAALLFTSVFFQKPIDLQDWVKPAPPRDC